MSVRVCLCEYISICIYLCIYIYIYILCLMHKAIFAGEHINMYVCIYIIMYIY